MEADIDDMYKVIKLYCGFFIGKKDIDSRLSEVCEFKNSYGFLFRISNKFDNCYWCIGKKNLDLYQYIPKADDFNSRRIITHLIKNESRNKNRKR